MTRAIALHDLESFGTKERACALVARRGARECEAPALLPALEDRAFLAQTRFATDSSPSLHHFLLFSPFSNHTTPVTFRLWASYCDARRLSLPSANMIEVAPADRECGAAPIVTEEVRSFIDVQFPSPSLFDTPLSIPGFDDNEVLEDGAISTPPLEEPEDASQEVDTWNWPESERIHLPPIERWEDLACIRTLDRFYGRGGLGERSYQILYRMCQIIWAIGNEVEIRNSKKVKLPRAERLAKFRRYCDALLEGVQLFKNNMKAQMNHVRESTSNLPVLHNVKAYQDLRPKLDEWHANIMLVGSCRSPESSLTLS